jgi:hypothetical protein
MSAEAIREEYEDHLTLSELALLCLQEVVNDSQKSPANGIPRRALNKFEIRKLGRAL